MRCPDCGALNPDLSRFCDGCGGELELRCPSCGRATSFPIRMCPSCGTDLPYVLPADENERLRWAGRTPLAFVHPIDGKLFRRVQESHACLVLARRPRSTVAHARVAEHVSDFAEAYPELTLQVNVWGAYAVGGKAEVALEPDAMACGLLPCDPDWLIAVPRVFRDALRREEVAMAVHRELFHLLVGNVFLFPLVAAARAQLGARERRKARPEAITREDEAAELVLRWFEFAGYSADRFALVACGGIEVYLRCLLKEAMVGTADEALVKLHRDCCNLNGEALLRHALEGLGSRPELFRRLWEANAFLRSSLGRALLEGGQLEGLWERARRRLATPLSDGEGGRLIPFPGGAAEEGLSEPSSEGGGATEPLERIRSFEALPPEALASSPLGLHGDFSMLLQLSAYENAIASYDEDFRPLGRIPLDEGVRFPRAITGGDPGQVWILDGEDARVWTLNLKSRSCRALDLPKGSLASPIDCAVDGMGRLWVADEARGLVVLSDQRVRAVHLGDGEGDRAWGRPYAVLHDRLRNAMWVLEGRGGRVVKLDLEGHFLFSFALDARDARAAAFALGPEGRLWIADARGDCLLAFDGGGRLEERLHPREVPLGEVTGLAVDGGGTIYAIRRRRPGIRVLSLERGDGSEVIIGGEGKDHFGFGSSLCLLANHGRA